jgi:MinD-like ATPase involved in chromosome partitioning or flagellar assembly
MEGSLEEFDLMSVVQTVSIGRQFTGVDLLDERGSIIGTMFMKAGQILSATAEGLSGIDAVKRLVHTRKSRRFFVYRGKFSDDRAKPVGPVGEVLMRVVESEAEHPSEGQLLFEGSLSEFALGTVLEAVSLGRTCVGIDVFSVDARHVGAVCVKAGKVLFAIAGKVTGQAAMDALLAAGEGRFVAYHTTLGGSADPLGSVRDVLWRSRERAKYKLDSDRLEEEDNESSWTQVRPPKSDRPSPLPPLRGGVSARFPRPEGMQPLPLPPVSGSHARARSFEERPAPTESQELPCFPKLAEPSASVSEAPRSTWSSAPVHGDQERTRRESWPSLSKVGSRASHRGTPIICVTSPKGGAGKTTVSLNLAVALARRGRRVVLVDADSNGLLAAVRAREEPAPGVSDIVEGSLTLEDAYLHTRLPTLRILPSGLGELEPISPRGWASVLEQVRDDAELVLVDCPPSVYGATRAVASVASHALMVVSADPAACRAVYAHQQALRAQANESLELLGIVLNMLDYHARPSLHVFEELCASSAGAMMMEVPIPRSSLLMEANARGVPMACDELSGAPAIAYCFELLATLALERLGMVEPMAFAEPLL